MSNARLARIAGALLVGILLFGGAWLYTDVPTFGLVAFFCVIYAAMIVGRLLL
jgi:hypothetical protein